MFSCYSYLTNCRAHGGASPSPPRGQERRGHGKWGEGCWGCRRSSRGLGHKAKPWRGCPARDPAVPPPAASRRAPKARRPRDALNRLPPRDNRAAAECLTAGCSAAGLLSVHTRDVEKVRWHFRGPGEGGGQERENRVRSRCRLLTCQMAKKMRAAHSTSESM